jgi:retron-type reverse transcriptase
MDEAWAGRRVVVEADIASFSDEVDHDVLLSALAEQVVDRKVLKAIRASLGAGVFVGEQLLSTETGTLRGVISPLLATSTCTGWTGNGNGVTAGWDDSSDMPTIV